MTHADRQQAICLTGYAIVLTTQLNITESLACQVQLHLQVQPFAACSVTVVCGFLLMYNVGSPQGTHAFSTTPQGACIILSAAGSVACIVMCLGVPHISRRLSLRVPEPMKRMSRLGLVSHDVHPKNLLYKPFFPDLI